MEQSFQPMIELARSEQADLAATCATPGYAIQHRIMRAQVDKFILALINTPVVNKDVVFANFLVAKAAAQFYQGVTDAINQENVMYYADANRSKRPEDSTEGVLDIGELASSFEDAPSFFGEGDAVIDE